jgi:signal transduction histidine kinase
LLTARELRRSLASERLAHAEAERANRTKDEFIAVISHDLRDPLSSIHLNLAVMQKMTRASSLDTAQPILASMERASLQMQRLVKGLLDIAAIEAGRFMLDRSPFMAGNLLQEVAEVLEPIARQKRIEIRVRVGEERTEVLGSRDHLSQVCSNLLANAIKFTSDGGVVEGRVFRDGGGTVFEIADSGPGLAAEDVPHIFDRFWRARGTRSQGMGLGLAIAKGIVEAHRGTIEVQSTQGRGTTFRFRIPDA